MDVLEAHGKAMTGFDRVVRQVGPDDWELPTPCTEWTVHNLVNHLVNEQRWVAPLLGGSTLEEVGDRFDGDLLGERPIDTWTDAAAEARAAWRALDALDGNVYVTAGVIDARQYGWEMTIDLGVHAWDLAKALGVAQPLEDELAAALLAEAAPAVHAWLAAGIIAEPVSVPADGPPVDRLVGLLGRDPTAWG